MYLTKVLFILYSEITASDQELRKISEYEKQINSSEGIDETRLVSEKAGVKGAPG